VQRQLQRNITSDRVSHLLERRAQPEELQRHGVLPDTQAAPLIQQVQRTLQHNLARANLYHALKRRPSLQEVRRRGLLADDPDMDAPAPRAQAAAAAAFERKHEEASSGAQAAYQRRSKNFHLTRILLKTVANMAEAGEISLQQKGALKDLIVDQDETILSVAETFDADNDVNEFKDSLLRLSMRRG
jgi:hypothetical protein